MSEMLHDVSKTSAGATGVDLELNRYVDRELHRLWGYEFIGPVPEIMVVGWAARSRVPDGVRWSITDYARGFSRSVYDEFGTILNLPRDIAVKQLIKYHHGEMLWPRSRDWHAGFERLVVLADLEMRGAVRRAVDPEAEMGMRVVATELLAPKLANANYGEFDPRDELEDGLDCRLYDLVEELWFEMKRRQPGLRFDRDTHVAAACEAALSFREILGVPRAPRAIRQPARTRRGRCLTKKYRGLIWRLLG